MWAQNTNSHQLFNENLARQWCQYIRPQHQTWASPRRFGSLCSQRCLIRQQTQFWYGEPFNLDLDLNRGLNFKLLTRLMVLRQIFCFVTISQGLLKACSGRLALPLRHRWPLQTTRKGHKCGCDQNAGLNCNNGYPSNSDGKLAIDIIHLRAWMLTITSKQRSLSWQFKPILIQFFLCIYFSLGFSYYCA